MPRLYIQVESPKYEAELPATCTANIHGEQRSVFLWESYINPRTSQVVYLSSVAGRYMTIPETNIVEGTVEHVCRMTEAVCKKQQ